MNDILKVFTIFTPKQLRECYFLFVVMLVGAALESAGIGAILPLISLMGQVDFLDKHQDIARLAQDFGISTHEQLIIAGRVNSSVHLKECLHSMGDLSAEKLC